MAERKITVSPELWEHLKKKAKKNIVVEGATSDTSDFDVSEIFIRTCNNQHRDYLINKRKYLQYEIQGVDPHEAVVLFPNYRLDLSDEISFGLKKIFFFNKITFEGIKL